MAAIATNAENAGFGHKSSHRVTISVTKNCGPVLPPVRPFGVSADMNAGWTFRDSAIARRSAEKEAGDRLYRPLACDIAPILHEFSLQGMGQMLTGVSVGN
jgi:hypothetical protein